MFLSVRKKYALNAFAKFNDCNIQNLAKNAIFKSISCDEKTADMNQTKSEANKEFRTVLKYI